MTTVYLVRHAEAEGNVYRRYHGWYNSLITENGYRQIEKLKARFESIHVDAVYSSDLFRTMTTAAAIYKPKGLPLVTDPDLREIGGGAWEDRSWGWLRKENEESLVAFNHADLNWSTEGSETYGEVQKRVVSAILRLAAAHDGQTIAIVAHGTAIRTALAHFSGLPADRIADIQHGDNTAVSCLEVDGDGARILFLNDNSHLGDLTTLGKQSWWKQGGVTGYGLMNLWFRPLDFAAESDFYSEARREAWENIHGTMAGYDGEGFLRDAKAHSDYDRRSVMVAMQEEKPVGILQMDLTRDADKGVGGIPFFYLIPELRCRGFGIQLIGQAVSTYRPLGRDHLRLRCAPENLRARRFYERYGFYKIGEEPGGLGTLDVLEKYIGYDPRI